MIAACNSVGVCQLNGRPIDVMIPPNGAGEIMRALDARRPDLRLMLSSGDYLDEDLKSQLAARGGRFLRKPYAPPVLLREVTEFFGSAADGSA